MNIFLNVNDPKFKDFLFDTNESITSELVKVSYDSIVEEYHLYYTVMNSCSNKFYKRSISKEALDSRVDCNSVVNNYFLSDVGLQLTNPMSLMINYVSGIDDFKKVKKRWTGDIREEDYEEVNEYMNGVFGFIYLDNLYKEL